MTRDTCKEPCKLLQDACLQLLRKILFGMSVFLTKKSQSLQKRERKNKFGKENNGIILNVIKSALFRSSKMVKIF